MKPLDLNGKRVVIAKTTHIGDVVISLPLAAAIKNKFPHCYIIFLANGATCSIANLSADIDEVCDWKAINSAGQAHAVAQLKALHADVFIHVNPSAYLAKVVRQAKIPLRIGSMYRWYHWLNCNRLAAISRHHAQYNKRQLDLQYLHAVGIKRHYSYEALEALYRFKPLELNRAHQQLLDPTKFNLILHPSLITAKQYQWPVAHYAELIAQLPQTHYQIFISGTMDDRDVLQEPLLNAFPQVVDLIGKLSLDQFMLFMQRCNGLVAGSTGPLHMAAAMGIHALGIYRPDSHYIKRWEPIGAKAEVIAQASPCGSCPNGTPCSCITGISPQEVKNRIERWRQ